jgi:Flp pilus assembly protein TadD
MRFIPVLVLAVALTACEMPEGAASGPVDLTTLAPLNSREQSLIYAADGAMQQGNYAAAERDYIGAMAESKGHIDAHLALARLYDKQNMPAKEKAVLLAATQLQPNHALANYLLGKRYLAEGRFEDARSAFQRGRTTRPEDLDLSIGEGIANDMLGEHRAAQRIYQRAMGLNRDANLINLTTNLALSHLLSDEPKRAVELLKPLVKKPGAPAVTRHNLALAYGMLGKNSEAKKILDGEIDEETRLLAVARMRQYVTDRANDIKATPPGQSITDVPAKEPQIAPSAAPVEQKAKPAAKTKPVVAPKPEAKITAEPDMEPAAGGEDMEPADDSETPADE